ncbi:MAG: hypothetical protein LBT05_00915 [Planctomycetaceae bacterium]|jgi:hypothetical protein|nr:hypothetical protein [Planctomycetaceae bacterium]
MTETNDIQSQKTGSIFDVKWNETTEIPEVASYRTLNVVALLSALFGILSPVTLINWGFAFVPIISLVFAFWGLYAIHRSEGMQFGKTPAYFGIFLSASIVAFNVILWQTYQNRIVCESLIVADAYFELLAKAKNDPSIDLMVLEDAKRPYWNRRGKDAIQNAWKALDKDSLAQEEMQGVVNDPCFRTLLALGGKAKATFYKVKSYYYDANNRIDYATLTYAVTYPNQDAATETFFVNLTLQRFHDEDSTTVANKKIKRGGWAVSSCKGPVLPAEFGGKPDA